MRENHLRTFDCKDEKCQRIKAQAPQIIDHLCEECHRHFREFLEFLDELGIPYSLNPYLVRGLDYYTKTVFEIFSTSAEGSGGSAEAQRKLSEGGEEVRARDSLVGGGRYDNLCKVLGREQIPASGGAAGIERIMEVLRARTKRPHQPQFPKVFLAQLGTSAKKKSLKLFEEFRKNRIPVAESFGRDSLKAQLRTADRIGVRFTLILGQKEVLDETIIVRDMKTGRQETIKLQKIVREMKKILKK